jgi:glycerol-3-phosphate acyltransferase PlsY
VTAAPGPPPIGIGRSLAVLGASYLAGAIPFSNLVARWRGGQDLRSVGSGTVSGTSLYRVAGFGALALGGSLDVAKGAVGPALAGPDHPMLAALAGASAVCGHNWSVFLRGRGGRGISPALGALLVFDWAGAAVLAAGLAGGRVARNTAVGSLAADVALTPVLGYRRGRPGLVAGGAIVTAMLAKRLSGNQHAPARRVYLHRLVYDRDSAEPIDPLRSFVPAP